MSRDIIFAEHHHEALRDLAAKFTSGNSVPVERATITRDEWESICAFVRDQETIIDDRDETIERLSQPQAASSTQAEPVAWHAEKTGRSSWSGNVKTSIGLSLEYPKAAADEGYAVRPLIFGDATPTGGASR